MEKLVKPIIFIVFIVFQLFLFFYDKFLLTSLAGAQTEEMKWDESSMYISNRIWGAMTQVNPHQDVCWIWKILQWEPQEDAGPGRLKPSLVSTWQTNIGNAIGNGERETQAQAGAHLMVLSKAVLASWLKEIYIKLQVYGHTAFV